MVRDWVIELGGVIKDNKKGPTFPRRPSQWKNPQSALEATHI